MKFDDRKKKVNGNLNSSKHFKSNCNCYSFLYFDLLLILEKLIEGLEKFGNNYAIEIY